MFRTVRGFLALAPPTYVVALLAYLAARPRAATTFVVYPFLADVLGSGLPRSATARFVVVATLFFLVPYLVAGVLLFLSDIGVSASASLWRKGPAPSPEGPRARMLAPEAFGTLVVASLLLGAFAGSRLPLVAHGGELPGGVNVAPAFVAAVPFLALGGGLLLALLASVPRAVARVVRRWSGADRGL